MALLSRSRRNGLALVNAARRSACALLEALESRTLMSVTIAANGKSGTFTDVDGDIVTVAVTKGTLTAGLFTTAPSGLGEQLQELDLTAAAFSGTNLTISVKQAGGGDGLTNVGFINASGNSLGKTIVTGDVGRIDAGASTRSGVTSLSVFSLGRQGTSSQAVGGSLVSYISTLGSLSVTTDVDQAYVNVAGSIGNINVGGSLIGGTAEGSGSIQANNNVGNVFIGQNISASTDDGATGASYAGSVAANHGSMGNVTVMGTLLGGAGYESGSIFADVKMGKVIVGGSLVGGGGRYSGNITTYVGGIASASIGGSIVGGAGYESGALDPRTIGSVAVSGSIIGGGGSYSGTFDPRTGGSVNIGGSIIGGDGDHSGTIAPHTIGNVTISGSIVGGGGENSGEIDADIIGNVSISGSMNGGSGDGAGTILCGSVGNVTIGGSIIGGTGADSGAVFANNGTLGNLGKVVVVGNLTGGDYNGSGNATDSFFTGYIEATGKITSVFIGGNVIAGNNTTSAFLESGTIRAGTTIGSVQINGSLMGSATQDAIIDAGASGMAIGSVLIGGSVINAQILAGYVTSQSGDNVGALVATHGGAQLGKITVSGDWTASSIMAGTTVGNDGLPGTPDDTPIAGVGSGQGKITSITIGGQVFGTVNAGDHFGFVSSSIGSFTAAGIKATLTTGKDNILIGGTDDVTILEV